MIKKLMFAIQSLAFLFPFSSQAEDQVTKKWLNENRTSIVQEEVLIFVICEAEQ